MILAVALPLALLTQKVTAQQATSTQLQLSDIMQGEQFVGFSPQGPGWLPDSKFIYFSWNPDQDTLRSTYLIKAREDTPVKLDPQEAASLVRNFEFNDSHSAYLYTRNGDLYLHKVGQESPLRITETVEQENNPKFAGVAEEQVLYQKGDDYFLWDSNTGTTRQLTNFQKGSAPREKQPAPAEERWLEQDNLQLFECLRWRKGQEKARENQREAADLNDLPKAIYLQGKRIGNIQISPDLRFVTYLLTDDADAKSTKVPNYVTASGYIEDLPSRSKVGAPQDTYTSYVLDLEKDSSYQINTEMLEGIFDKPAFLEDYHEGEGSYEDQYEQARPVIVLGPVFSKAGKAVVVVRAQDNKDRWICELDCRTGNLILLDRQHDEAWIGGPGIGNWNFAAGNIGWIDNDHFWFQSEETGYSHLYRLNVNTGSKTALTTGDFEILDAQLSKDKSTFFLHANAEGPENQDFYHLPAKGGAMIRITDRPGAHEVKVSPDEQQLLFRYSYSNQPWEIYRQANKPGAEPEQLTESTAAAFQAYDWREPQLIRFKARDGALVPARLYRPEATSSAGPAIIFVHGAGYLQNAHNWWSSYYREFMFHNFLADRGYTVLDIDYRGSAGYGRDWRTAIYRHMGGQDLDDQVDGAAYLVKELGIDPERIGIYGGSYGGFITLMALFKEPGTFKAGAALRSVTDWAHYNHGYTSDILNTPVEDSLAYRRSSPIYHAEGLQDHLLILHGMVDRNVQFQDVVRLAQRLIELKKENWEFALFPIEGHGFIEPSSWTDEYRRIFELFEERLK